MSLLPTHDDLLPGATKAASALLDALAEGSIVIVDRGRAEAAIADALATQTRATVQRTAREAAELINDFAKGSKSPSAQIAYEVAVDMVKKSYEAAP